MIDSNTPVIVGVGQYTDRLDASDYRGLSNVELAAESARRACEDAASVDKLAAHIDGIASLRTFEDSTPRYSTPFGKSNNFPHSIARRLGVTPKVAVWAPVGGDSPQTMVAEFCEKIASGAVKMALVVGAEAISTAKHLIAETSRRTGPRASTPLWTIAAWRSKDSARDTTGNTGSCRRPIPIRSSRTRAVAV